MSKKTKDSPFANFEKAVKKVLKTTKSESDEQIERFQASN